MFTFCDVLHEKKMQNKLLRVCSTNWKSSLSSLSYLSSFAFAFLLICSQPKAEAVLAEILVVKNDIAHGKNY